MNASIIIPLYNSEKTLEECITALLKQDFKGKYEIVVVDDGSKDSSLNILKKLSKKNSVIKIISQENSGPARARNRGAENAKYDVLVFIDSDCVAEKSWLREMIEPFFNKNVIGVQGRYETKQKELAARFGQLEIEHRYNIMKRHSNIDFIGSYSAAYKKNIFLEEKGFDEQFRIPSGEDPELSYRLAAKGFWLVFNPKAIVYHYHPAEFKTYMKVKFNRAFWRVRMYKKHLNKAVKDTYTPQEIKFQIVLFYFGIISLFASIFYPEMFIPGVIMFGLIVAFSIPFSLWAIRKDFTVGLISPLIIFLRTITFGTGLAYGVFRGLFK